MATVIGALRERVILQARSDATDAIGAVVYSWATVATLWARVRPVNSRESTIADRIAATAFYEVTIRHRSDVSPTGRLVWRNRVLNVVGITNPDERRAYIALMVQDMGPYAGLPEPAVTMDRGTIRFDSTKYTFDEEAA